MTPCIEDPDRFFPEDEKNRGAVLSARKLCRGCPIQDQCLEMGLEPIRLIDGTSVLPAGIWGGLTHDERRKLKPGPLVTKPLCGTDAGASWHRRVKNELPCPRCQEASRVADLRRRRVRVG